MPGRQMAWRTSLGPIEVLGRLPVEGGGDRAVRAQVRRKGAPDPLPVAGGYVLVPYRRRLIDVAVDIDHLGHQ